MSRVSIVEKTSIAKRTVYTAVFTILVFIATVSIAVYIPATRGYFNLGETMIYTTALLTLDPLTSLVACGLGSALADLYLGYGQYAPATLVIKAIEGFLVVLLYRLFKKIGNWRLLVLILSITSSTLLFLVGYILYSGTMELTILGQTYRFEIPFYFWIIASLILLVVVENTGLKHDPETGYKALAVVIAGLEMVTGYFIYEAYILGYGVAAALVEVPANIGQVVIGLSVSIPLVETLYRAGIKTSV